MLNKLKSPRFWIAAIGAALMVLLVSGVRIPAPVINEIMGFTGGILVLFGIVPPPAGGGQNPAEEPKSGKENQTE